MLQILVQKKRFKHVLTRICQILPPPPPPPQQFLGGGNSIKGLLKKIIYTSKNFEKIIVQVGDVTPPPSLFQWSIPYLSICMYF
jgi:hypothetical protein